MIMDSTGKPIYIGDRVKFRGEEFTIKSFGKRSYRGMITIEFEEPITHTEEIPDEFSVDLI